MAGKPWTDDELAFLRTHYETKGRDWVTQKLNRTIDAVSHKAQRLGLRVASECIARQIGDYHRGRPKSLEHRAKLAISNQGQTRSTETREKLRKIANTPEALARARAKAFKYFVTNPWTPHEETFLKTHYTKQGSKWCAQRLGRSRGTIYDRAHKLKLRVPHEVISRLLSQSLKGRVLSEKHIDNLREHHKQASVISKWLATLGQVPWSAKEEDFLRAHYSNHGARWCSERLKRTPKAIYHRASQLGLSVLPEVAARNCSLATKGTRTGPDNPFYGKPRAHGKRVIHTKPSGEVVKMRSTWEGRVAGYLTQQGISWQYEKYTFTLNIGTYTPDFYLVDTDEFWEVKGYMTSVAQRKLNEFAELYPNARLTLIDKDVMKSLNLL